jgi:hypothetical protein
MVAFHFAAHERRTCFAVNSEPNFDRPLVEPVVLGLGAGNGDAVQGKAHGPHSGAGPPRQIPHLLQAKSGVGGGPGNLVHEDGPRHAAGAGNALGPRDGAVVGHHLRTSGGDKERKHYNE